MNIFKKLLRKIKTLVNGKNILEDHISRGLIVGKNFKMLEDVIIDYCHTWHIKIGDDVTLAPRVQILAHDASTAQLLKATRVGKVKIGSRVFIGSGSIIMPGVTIGNDVIVGAGSVVTRSVPDGQVVCGSPAKRVRSIDDFLHRKIMEIEMSPCFGTEYTINRNLTEEMKNEMNAKMIDNIGYLVWK